MYLNPGIRGTYGNKGEPTSTMALVLGVLLLGRLLYSVRLPCWMCLFRVINRLTLCCLAYVPDSNYEVRTIYIYRDAAVGTDQWPDKHDSRNTYILRTMRTTCSIYHSYRVYLALFQHNWLLRGQIWRCGWIWIWCQLWQYLCGWHVYNSRSVRIVQCSAVL